MDIDNLYISNIHGAAGKLIRCRLQSLTDENHNILNTLERTKVYIIIITQNLTDENHNILNTLERTKVYIIIITIPYIQSIRAISCLLACNW
jgi:vacuolar-type H+-ATPase subunit F/Vma7